MNKEKGIGTIAIVVVVVIIVAIVAGVGAWYFMGGEEGEQQEFKVAFIPSGHTRMVMEVNTNRGIWEEEMSEANAKINISYTFDDVPLWVSGKVHTSTASVLEATRVAQETGEKMVIVGKVKPLVNGWLVKKGSKWDPANTGSVQATIDKLVDEQAPFGLVNWAWGSVPFYQLLLKEEFGYDFKEDGDFNVVSADPPAIPKLIEQGDLAAGGAAAEDAFNQLMRDTLTPLFWGTSFPDKYGVPPLSNLAVRKSYYDEHKEIVEKYVAAWNRGMEIYHNEGRELITQEKYMKEFPLESVEDARFMYDYAIGLKEGISTYDASAIYPQASLTDEDIEETTTFLNMAADMGLVTEDWQDYIEFAQL